MPAGSKAESKLTGGFSTHDINGETLKFGLLSREHCTEYLAAPSTPYLIMPDPATYFARTTSTTIWT